MGDQSPGWKRPSDTMKKRIIRKKSSVGLPVNSSQMSSAQSSTATSPRHGRAGKKRQNPFASSNKGKKLHLDSDVVEPKTDPETSSLFSVLDKAEQGLVMQCSEDRQQADTMREMLARLSRPLQSVENTSLKGQEQRTSPADSKPLLSERQYKYYPVDWSLKSKLRYISPKPFSWCHPLKSAEESTGLTAFVQQQDMDRQPDSCMVGNSLEAKVRFQQGCMVWMHPSLSWLKLFPRITGDTKIGKPSQVLHSEDIQKSLLNEWTESFTSLFHLLRNKKCEYFYLCAHHFTVLFKSTGIPGLCEDLHAILTPTSRGLREALKNEGIDFFMPLNSIEKMADNEEIECEPKKKTCNTDAAGGEEVSTDRTCDVAVDQDIEETDEGAASWLETLGIDKNKYRSLDPNKVKLQRDIFKIIDNRPESTVLVEGGETMALFNYLLNCRSCIDNTGDLAGVPPTLLASVAFKGATLRPMQVKQGSVRQQQKMGLQDGYILEVTGPVLPCHVQRLNRLFKATQGEFNLNCRVQETSAPFNLSSKSVDTNDAGQRHGEDAEQADDEDMEGEKEGAVNCRIGDINNGRQAVRELNYKDGYYTWT